MSQTGKILDEFPNALKDIICNRGLCDDNLQEFLYPDYSKLNDPFLFKDMKKAVERILIAISKNEKIVIYSDFDADGIPAGIILKDVFDKIKYSNYINYIPHRNKEGYGLHKDAICKFSENDVSLIITVDVGIGALESVKLAHTYGMDVIVTDHHEPKSGLPEAYAIINPKIKNDKYPFKDLCGAGVAFKLSQALIAEGKNRQMHLFDHIQKGWEKWLLDMVAIATISDMVPLTDENRILAYWGLVVLRKTRRMGIREFARHFRLHMNYLDEKDVGFSIAPKINAASRMGSPDIAFKLFSSNDFKDVQSYIIELERLNKRRQVEVAKITKEAKKKIRLRGDLEKVLVTGDKRWHTALLGLSASKLAEEFNTTVCLWGEDESGAFRGSCRSANDCHIAHMFEKTSEFLVEFGGHEGAGGFTTNFDSLFELEKAFNKAVQGERINIKSDFKYDAELSSDDVTWTFYNQLRRLGPFGLGNEAPIFKFANIKIISKRLFGKNREHLEIIFTNNTLNIKAVAFYVPDSWKDKENVRNIFGIVERSVFMGKIELRVSITHLD